MEKGGFWGWVVTVNRVKVELVSSVYTTVYIIKPLLKKGKNETTFPLVLFDYLCCRVTRLPVSGSGLTW